MTQRTVFQSMAQRHVVNVAPTASAYVAACVMARENCGSVLVIEPGSNTLLGIVTERDILTRLVARALDPAQTLVTAIMTRNPICVGPQTPVSEAVLTMIERGFRHLPVVHPETGRILGVFSARDAMSEEVNAAQHAAEFNQQVNDALG